MTPLRWRWPLVAAGLAAWALGLHWAMLQASSTAWVQRLCVAQHAGIHAILAWIFGSTLRPRGTALVTQLAERVHRSVTPAMRGYTRRLTAVWCGYFVAMAALSLALYAWAPWSWWSLFGNVLTPLSLVLFFAIEHALRYRWHPEFERASIAQALAAWRGASVRGAASGPGVGTGSPRP
jgi:uncharacterized membrane protein